MDKSIYFGTLTFLLVVTLSTVAAKPHLVKRPEKCFDGLGCYHTTAHLPDLPDDLEQIGTQFLMYSHGNKQEPAVIDPTVDMSTLYSPLSVSNFDPHKDTKFITHGYSVSGKSTWVTEMKDELLKKGDFNVIVISWPGGSRTSLSKAVANVFVVAAQAKMFIDHLLTGHQDFDLARVHLIGHSFGAQILGNVGAKLSGAVGRITGLDPGEPFFKQLPNSMRLDKADAKFVDIIHTDGEPFNGFQGYGMFTALGHADFYPNGGVDQPGCSDDLFQGIVGLLGGQPDASLACSHSRAVQFFIASINSPIICTFIAHPCNNWEDYEAGRCKACPSGGCPVMGYETITSARGTFYLASTSMKPFCGKVAPKPEQSGYEYYVKLELKPSMNEDSFGRFYITLHGQLDTSEAEFSRDDLHYHKAITAESHVVAVDRYVGAVSGVTVRFHRKTGLGVSGNGATVFIHKVLVRDPTSGDSVEFCAGDLQLTSDQPHIFTSTC